MTEAIGWIGSMLFAFCGAPAAYKCYKDGHTDMSRLFLWMWLVGEIFMQAYVLLKHGFDMPLLWNYWLNILFACVIMRYMYFPRRL